MTTTTATREQLMEAAREGRLEEEQYSDTTGPIPVARFRFLLDCVVLDDDTELEVSFLFAEGRIEVNLDNLGEHDMIYPIRVIA